MDSEAVVVTGGGSGIGADIAMRLADGGHHVVIVGRRVEPLAATAASAREAMQSARIETVAADVSTVAGTRDLVAAIGDRRLAGIVTAAGGQGAFLGGGTDPVDVERRWDEALRKNFYSALLPVEALAPNLLDQRGRVVLISSTAALDGQGGPYASAKAALVGYGMDLARRLGTRGVTANVVAPGFVGATGFFEAGGLGSADDMAVAAARATLVGRVGAPADVTHIVVNLLHEGAGWITGQVISPNGGTVLVN